MHCCAPLGFVVREVVEEVAPEAVLVVAPLVVLVVVGTAGILAVT